MSAPADASPPPAPEAWSPGVVAAALAATGVACLPLLVPALRERPALPGAVQAGLAALAYASPLGVVAACFRWAPLGLDPRRRAALFALLLAIALLQVHLHLTNVDTVEGSVMVPNAMAPNNTAWQLGMQRSVLRLEPEAHPHSARFLPNGLVHLLDLATGRYVIGRTLYRVTFQFLLLLAIYALGRVWFRHAAAVGGVLAYALIYPISIRYYAGQLTDPLSHLSFVVALRLLVTGPFAYLALTLAVGLLAKESVILVAAWHALAGPWSRAHARRAALLLGGGLLEVWAVRAAVHSGPAKVDTMSGLWLTNVEWVRFWGPQVAFTVGLYLPFLAVAWRQTPPPLRGAAAFLTVGLLATSLRFSWLYEARNFVPAAIPLGLIAAAYVTGELDDPPPPPSDAGAPGAGPA